MNVSLKKGFTLIELLAVIVILAIIALIATPIVMNIIEDTKTEANKRSVENYVKAIENAVMQYMMNNNGIAPNEYDDIKDYINYSGTRVSCSNLGFYSGGKITVTGCRVNEIEVDYFYTTVNYNYANYSDEEIENDNHIFGIGADNKNDVVAIFNENFTSVKVINNTKNSNGKIISWMPKAGEKVSDGTNDITKVNLSESIFESFNPFYAYRGIITNVEFEEGITEIGDYAFIYCKKLIGELKLPDSLFRIGYASFYYCNNLTSISQLPRNLVSIESYAFGYCKKIVGVLNIPNTVRIIGNSAFNSCTELTGLTFANNSRLESIGKGAFNGCTALAGELNIPSSVKTIGAVAFQYCSKFTNLILNEGLEWVGDFAFNHLSSLRNTQIYIPSTVKQLGGYSYRNSNDLYGTHMFYDCGNYNEFVVGEGSTSYKTIDGVLYNISGDTLITYPKGKIGTDFVIPLEVTRIYELALGRNSRLQNVTLPDSYLLEDYIHFTTTTDPYINNSGTNLAIAFYFNSVRNVLVHDTNPNYISVNGLLLSKDGTKLRFIPFKNNSGGTITIPSTVTEISEYAVWGGQYSNAAATHAYTAKKLVIPASVTYIATNSLKQINLEKNGSYWEIEIASDNPNYTLNEAGNLVAK